MSTANDWAFPTDTVTFLTELHANNNRDWFKQHKSRYEQFIKGPANEFCNLMCQELQQITAKSHGTKIFRVHRDVRFSKDKTPYNAHLHISFLPAGHQAAWFFGLDRTKLTVGAGLFAFDKTELETYRNRVAAEDRTQLAEILETLLQKGFRVPEPELKRVPAGFDKDHARSDLLRRKGLAAWYDFPDPNPATTPGLVNSCRKVFGELRSMMDWLE